jgi:transposase
LLHLLTAGFDVVDGARSQQRAALGCARCSESHQGAFDMQITTIGLDIAKNVFQVHGIDAAEKVVVRKQLRRSQVLAFFKALAPCLVGMEACATAHYWARELTKLGHQVRLMSAKDVKAYIKRNKNDAADAEAICEAVRRPTMRFVQVKSADQQAQLMQHRARDLLMQQRTQLINAMRSHLAELGIIAPQGREGVKDLLAIISNEDGKDLPNDARASLIVLAAQLRALQTTIGMIEKRIVKQHSANKESRRLQTVPGIGVIGASAIAATVTNPRIFRSGRDFAAWIGLVPRQMSTGGKPKLGPISKQGDRYLRRLLVVGAVSVLRRAKLHPGKFPWITQMLARRPFKVVAVALANKMARIAWALMMSGKTCRAAWFAAA